MLPSDLQPILGQIPSNLEGTGLSLFANEPRSTGATFFLECELPEEVPCFTQSKPWELWYPGGLELEVDTNGLLKISEACSPDGLPIYAQIQIQSFLELLEASEAFLNPQAPVPRKELPLGQCG